METKSGIKIPVALSSRLQKNKSLKEGWDKLRPSCQLGYVERINKAKGPDDIEIKLKKVIELTLAYAKKHPNKYSKRKEK